MDGTATAKRAYMERDAFALSRDDLRQIARRDVMERGEHLYFRGAVEDLRQEGGLLRARVRGNTGIYDVELASEAGFWSCTCRKGQGRRVQRAGDPAANDACKHVVALGFARLLGTGGAVKSRDSARDAPAG